MPEPADFRTLLERIRSGDEAAATELVRRYEPAIRRAIRVRLGDPSLNRIIDSMDICQSVLASFFLRVHLGQYSLHTADELLGLLKVMASNKVRDHVRRLRAARRDCRLTRASEPEMLEDLQSCGASPERIVSGQELVRQVRSRMSAEEWGLVEQRAAGWEWDEISASVGRGPEALRKQLSRAIDRTLQELGLEDAPDE